MVWCGRRHRCRQRCCVGVCVLDFCLRWMRPLFACVSAERDREVAARTPDVMCPHRSRRKWTKRKQSAGCCRLEFCMLIEKKNGCTHFCLETTVHIELCVNSQRMPVRTMAQHPLFTAIRYDQHALMTRSHSFYRFPIALLLSLKWTNGFGSNKRHRQIIQTSLVQIRNSIDGRDIVLRRGILYRHRCHPQRQTLDDVMHIQTVETFNVIDTIENEPRFEFNQFSHEFSKKKKKLLKLCERRRHRYQYGLCGSGINETFIRKLVSEVRCKNYERQMSGGRISNFSSAFRFISISSRRAQNRNWNSPNEGWTTDASTQR